MQSISTIFISLFVVSTVLSCPDHERAPVRCVMIIISLLKPSHEPLQESPCILSDKVGRVVVGWLW